MIISINKPVGMTSHDVVDEVRRITGEKRVGHGGTLDPSASGVLVVGISRESTKKLKDILKNTDKEYMAVLELGKISATGDSEGQITESASPEKIKSITKSRVESVLKKFRGEAKQIPPQYSAVKVGGTPAYVFARRGEKISLPKRKVFIKKIDLLEFSPPFVTIRVVASSGTYIRTLAEDIGKKLGTGAYLQTLTRTRVGSFTIKEAIPLNMLEQKIHPYS